MPILDKQLWSSVQSRILLLLLLHSSAILQCLIEARAAGGKKQKDSKGNRLCSSGSRCFVLLGREVGGIPRMPKMPKLFSLAFFLL